MNKETKLKLRASKPKATQVNKPVIWSLFAIILLVIVVVIVSALQTAQPKKSSSSETMSNNFNTAVAPEVQKLPASYSSSSLGQYLSNQSGGMPQSLRKELTALKQKQSELEQQLASHSEQQTNNQKNNQALHSALFFPGSAPQNTRQKKAQKHKKQEPNNNQKNNQRQTDYQKQNMQSQKMDFYNDSKQDDSDIYNTHPLVKPVSPYEVQAGTLLPAVLLTAINTSLPGEVVARVRSNVYDTVSGKFLLIPKGSKLIGQYDTQVSYGQSRALIVFKRIIRPNGSSILIHNSPGADLFGQAGMQGKVNNHWGRVMGSAVLSTILSVGVGAAASNSFSNNGYYPSSGENALLSGASNVSQVGQNIANKAMNIQPTLIIPTGYEFNIIVNKDMVLSPYQRSANGQRAPLSSFGKMS